MQHVNQDDWTGASPISSSSFWSNDEFDNPVHPELQVQNVYLAIDQYYLYINYEFPSWASLSESSSYVVEIYPQNIDSDVNYFQLSIRCGELIQVLEKPRNGAVINWTASSRWNEIKDNFNISIHSDSLEIKALQEYLAKPTEIQVKTEIYSNSDWVGQVELQEWNFDLCSTTDMVCGNEICEEFEGDVSHICVCPTDCPDMDTTCLDTDCGNGWCEEDEKAADSPCPCPEDCPDIVPVGAPCQIRDPIVDWSNADELVMNQEKRENENGTDLLYLKSEVDKENLYLKIELEPDETPHGNLSYNIRFHPWMSGIEYITLKINCDGVYEVLEKRSDSPTATNYTSRSDWTSIRGNFSFSTTEHAVEVKVPWYTIYKTSGMNMEVRSYRGNSEVDHMSASIEDFNSLFVNNCGDGACTAEENDSYNRYQFCPQDCPNVGEQLWQNGICDEGEDDRWGELQWIWDCPEVFQGLVEDGPNDGKPDDGTDDMTGPIIVIAIIVVVVTGVYRGVRRVYSKATAGRRKKSDMKSRKGKIAKERKDLQAKFLETRISEEQFHKQMTELDREEQNINLELKK
jgi:hypothetical protein